MRRKLIRALIALSLILAALIVRTLHREDKPLEGKRPPQEKSLYRVVNVHDGDTVTVDIHGRTEKIRLIGVDAPELGQKPWGEKAKEHLEEILSGAGWAVSLEYDVGRQDRYGRQLAYLWTGDKEMINRRMLFEGYAVLLTVPPNVRHVELFKDAQKDARSRWLGIWGRDGLTEKPAKYRKRNN